MKQHTQQTTEAKVSRTAQRKGGCLAETCIALAIIGLLVAMLWSVHYKETVQMPATFAAWVKQTGNEKHLTYEEWRLLMCANKKQNDTTIIFMPH
jgi:hypothetical protein